MTSFISIEKLGPRENLEEDIREGHKRPRYVFKRVTGSLSGVKEQTWCDEGGDIADKFNIDELIVVIAENYDGKKHDKLEIGRRVAEMYESLVEWELERFDERAFNLKEER